MLMLVSKPRSSAEMRARDRGNDEGFVDHPRESREGSGTPINIDAADTQLDRKRGREFSDDPIANRYVAFGRCCQPTLCPRRIYLFGERRD
jgi:hypothetical protein